MVDARYEHVRENGHEMSEGMLPVEGIDKQAYREVIGAAVAPGEDQTSRRELSRGLIERPLIRQRSRV